MYTHLSHLRQHLNNLNKIANKTVATPWKPIKRRGKWYMLSLDEHLINFHESSYETDSLAPSQEVVDWMNEFVGEDNWKYKASEVFDIDSTNGHIHQSVDNYFGYEDLRLYFPNIETLTMFRLRWVHGS